MDVSVVAASWFGSSHIVVFPKQEATLWQSLECHLVYAADIDGRLGGFAAFQPADKAEIQLGGDAYDYPCARQFFVRRPLQGFSILQKRISNAVRGLPKELER